MLGSVHDFISSSNMEPLVRADHLVELIVTLGQYKEEGRDYSPEVYLCHDVTKALTTLSIRPTFRGQVR